MMESERTYMLLRLGYGMLMAIAAVVVVSYSTRDSALANEGMSSPTATPAESPKPVLHFQIVDPNAHVLFVLGLGGDAATRSKLVAALAEQLQNYSLLNQPWVIPEPDWSVRDYLHQCGEHWQQTDGAFFVGLASTASGGSEEFFRRRMWAEVDANVLFAKCSRAYRHKDAAEISWHSPLEHFRHSMTTPLYLNALSLILTFGAAYEALAPSKTSIGVTTTVFPTTAPLPPSGTVSQIVKTSQTQTNGASLGTIATNLLAQSFFYANSSAAIPMADEHAWNAVEGVITKIVGEMNCRRLDPPMDPTRSLTSAPFCGK